MAWTAKSALAATMPPRRTGTPTTGLTAPMAKKPPTTAPIPPRAPARLRRRVARAPALLRLTFPPLDDPPLERPGGLGVELIEQTDRQRVQALALGLRVHACVADEEVERRHRPLADGAEEIVRRGDERFLLGRLDERQRPRVLIPGRCVRELHHPGDPLGLVEGRGQGRGQPTV
jgi:hypothetical protein